MGMMIRKKIVKKNLPSENEAPPSPPPTAPEAEEPKPSLLPEK